MAVGTTRGKRRLGRHVKPIRVRSELKPEDVAALARCSRPTITRLESGENLPRYHLFATILNVIGATPSEQQRAFELWEIANTGAVTIQHAEELPAKYRRFRMDESEATVERTLDTVVFPGLLTTADYPTIISRARQYAHRAEDWASHAAAERRERQALLTRAREPLHLHALIDESVFTRTVGDREVMIAQLDHVMEMAARSNVMVQVIPRNFGAHGAMSGPLFILSYPDDDEADEAYVESFLGIENVSKQDVAAISRVWGEIAAAAPSEDESVEIIRSIRDTWMKG